MMNSSTKESKRDIHQENLKPQKITRSDLERRNSEELRLEKDKLSMVWEILKKQIFTGGVKLLNES